MNELNAFFNKFQSVFGSDTSYLYTFYRAVIATAVFLLVWFVLKRILKSVEKKAEQAKQKIDLRLFTTARRVLLYGLIFVTGTYLIRAFNLLLIEKAFHAFFIILMALPVNNFFAVILTYLEKNIAARTKNKVDNIIFNLLNKFTGVIIYLTAIILALDILGINVMPFIAGAGIVGIAIGFAAKDTLSNIIAGILLIIDRPFETGDRIEVWSAPTGSATWGDVIDIGLRATKIRTTDNIVIIIPNNEIMKRDIVNYTIITSKIRIRINIGVGYDADIKKAKEIIMRVVDSSEWVAKDPLPKVVVKDFGDSAVNLQLRVWIYDARKRMDTISWITDKVKEEFDKEGIEIPYPKRDITITNKK
jgi:small-conductance mechanosensitive channel